MVARHFEVFSHWASHKRSILRIVTGLLFLQHGTAKYLAFPYVPGLHELSWSSLPGIAGLFELIGSVFIVLGLYTRPVAFLLSGLMAVAYWYAHAPRHWAPLVNGGELAILYCFVFLYFTFAGPGLWSLDAKMRTKV